MQLCTFISFPPDMREIMYYVNNIMYNTESIAEHINPSLSI